MPSGHGTTRQGWTILQLGAYAGFVESGNPRCSQTIDEIVYGRNN